jgi:hypothetical protein
MLKYNVNKETINAAADIDNVRISFDSNFFFGPLIGKTPSGMTTYSIRGEWGVIPGSWRAILCELTRCVKRHIIVAGRNISRATFYRYLKA